jgi:hypothetical protein
MVLKFLVSLVLFIGAAHNQDMFSRLLVSLTLLMGAAFSQEAGGGALLKNLMETNSQGNGKMDMVSNLFGVRSKRQVYFKVLQTLCILRLSGLHSNKNQTTNLLYPKKFFETNKKHK